VAPLTGTPTIDLHTGVELRRSRKAAQSVQRGQHGTYRGLFQHPPSGRTLRQTSGPTVNAAAHSAI